MHFNRKPKFVPWRSEEGKRRRREVVKYMKEELPKSDIPAAEDAEYDERTGKFVPEIDSTSHEQNDRSEPFEEGQIQGDDDLTRALLRLKDLNLIPSLDIDVKNCSWNDVFHQMDDANVQYAKKAEGFKGFAVKFWRSMGKRADDAAPWLEFIPSEVGGGILKSGLALAKKSYDKKEKIFSAMEDIPFVIMRAQVMRRRFPRHEDLKTACSKGYETILEATADLISYLLPEKEVKKVLFFFNRRASTGKIDGTLAKVKAEAENLRRFTEDIWEEMLVLMNDNVAHIKKRGDEMYTMADEHLELGKKTNAGVTELKASFKELADASVGMLASAADRAAADKMNIMNYIMPFLEERLRQMEERILQGGQYPSREPKSQALITPEILIEFLEVSPQQPFDDLNFVLRQSRGFSAISMGQANSLLRTEEFGQWSQPQRPSLLLVNGMIELDGPNKISSISFLAASLVTSLAKLQPEAEVIYFFCGLHTPKNDQLRGPNGVLRSLVWQMLLALERRKSLSLEFINTRSLRDALEQSNLEALCYTFQELLFQLQLGTPVYCIVDGIDWYEGSQASKDLEYLIRELGNLAESDQLPAVFKVLMTSSYQSRIAARALNFSRNNQCVFLRPDLSDSGILLERKMEVYPAGRREQKVTYTDSDDQWYTSDEDEFAGNNPYT
ncbi:hypothetical protein AJ80_02942 [Polytolypa hystricis UAMH7299]|uniref:Nephrocystin 3-like N-terminal domain-containing protein n=1 Tax=Polytolypa hystricis (strain UAMH7299) TaxID=1447883 RepID=A0A2B7YQW5_POLH7|nr:hypothetical protein AJ80_02942 [Polytolypa hystricis UAMH7299]